MKKSKLVIEYDFDFDAWGLTAALRGYRLAWEINQRLDVHLVRQPDLIVGFKGNVEKAFAYYDYETPGNTLKLFRNAPDDPVAGKYFLIPEYPHFDFVILARLNEHPLTDSFIDTMREIPGIQLVNPIDVSMLKSKSNFVF